jgi:phosphate transport system substrate-binding protein
MLRTFALTSVAALALVGCGQNGGGAGGSRDQIRVVGSSTVYPFTQIAAERFGSANSQFKAPVIESTGTGAGMKLFCAGVGAQHPDIEDASRRIKKSEFDTCEKNGVGPIVEIQVGIDGIAFAESKQGGATSTPRSPRSRSRSTARPRPAARATRSPS